MIRDGARPWHSKKRPPGVDPDGHRYCSLDRKPCQLRRKGLGTIHQFSKPLATFNFGDLAPIVLQHEQPERRRKIALLTLRIDGVNKRRQVHKSLSGNLLSPFQNSSSRLTLVLWPARTIERLTTGDFMQNIPHLIDLQQRTKN